MPREGTLNLSGLKEKVDLNELFHVPRDFWLQECEEIAHYMHDQVGDDLPDEIAKQLHQLKDRVVKMEQPMRKQSAI